MLWSILFQNLNYLKLLGANAVNIIYVQYMFCCLLPNVTILMRQYNYVYFVCTAERV